ncbi:MAG: hypothetical protein ACI9XO_003886 [Paraglaciecola sp.]|jgi:hypothetical protein
MFYDRKKETISSEEISEIIVIFRLYGQKILTLWHLREFGKGKN